MNLLSYGDVEGYFKHIVSRVFGDDIGIPEQWAAAGTWGYTRWTEYDKIHEEGTQLRLFASLAAP